MGRFAAVGTAIWTPFYVSGFGYALRSRRPGRLSGACWGSLKRLRLRVWGGAAWLPVIVVDVCRVGVGL